MGVLIKGLHLSGIFFIILATILIAQPSFAQAEPASGVPAGSLKSQRDLDSGSIVTVTGHIDPGIVVNGRRDIVSEYVRMLKPRWMGREYKTSGYDFPTWGDLPCVFVHGLTEPTMTHVKDAITARMKEELSHADASCSHEVDVYFTNDYDDLARQANLHPSFVGYGNEYGAGDLKDLASVREAVHWTEVIGADGEFRHLVIVVNSPELPQVSLYSICDYLAFVALTGPHNFIETTRVNSIVNLLNTALPSQVKAPHWSALDEAFLKALYKDKRFFWSQEAGLVERTRRNLAHNEAAH